jgi:hypothetical protein
MLNKLIRVSSENAFSGFNHIYRTNQEQLESGPMNVKTVLVPILDNFVISPRSETPLIKDARIGEQL